MRNFYFTSLLMQEQTVPHGQALTFMLKSGNPCQDVDSLNQLMEFD